MTYLCVHDIPDYFIKNLVQYNCVDNKMITVKLSQCKKIMINLVLKVKVTHLKRLTLIVV